MTLTIREALQLPDMVHTRLIAGASGLDQPIRWVTIVEVLEDARRLQEGEFLITTGYGLEADSQKQAEFIPALAEQKLSGVAIHTGFYLREIPETFLAAADHYGLPLIEIPSAVNFSTITKAILQPIVNRQFETLAYSQEIHEQIIKVALSGGGLQAIARELARLTSGHVSIVDSLGFEVIQTESTQGNESAKKLSQSVPISAKEIYGHLTLTKAESAWHELDQIALRHATTLCALEFVKEQAIASTEWRIQGDFVEDLISGRLPWSQEAEARCRMLGFPITGKQIIVAIRLKSLQTLQETVLLPQRLPSLIKRLAARQKVLFLLRERTNHLLVILPDEPSSQKLLEQVKLQWEKLEPSTMLTIGVSTSTSAYTDWARAVEEAEFALLVSPILHTKPTLSQYSQLGGYQFLFPYHLEPARLKQLFWPLLEQIIQYDQKHSQQLLETLLVYLQNNANGLQAASALFIHRHTLKYRLQLIEDKTGSTLSDANHRWQLQLAMMAYRLYQQLYESVG